MRENNNCTGCHACINICPNNCIIMNENEEGFLYPDIISSKCTNCGLCKSVCPIVSNNTIKRNVEAFACINKDDFIRKDSSSGGMFNLLAELIIDNNGIVFGAEFNENFKVIHGYAETKEELRRFRGSKYVQSVIGNTYKQARDFLESEKQVMFTGTPCQISGLKSYLRRDYENLLCVDFICHGVPSPKIF